MSLDFRKDIFANERNDDLNVVGKPILRQDILGMLQVHHRFLMITSLTIFFI